MNTGGTVSSADFELTLVNALHSSSQDVYLGNPNGIIIAPQGWQDRSTTWAIPTCLAAWR